MSDLNLKELLGKFTIINELSKIAIDDLSNQNIDSSVSRNESFIGNLSKCILSLNKEAVELKKLHSELLTENSKCLEGSPAIETSSNEVLANDSIQDSTKNCIIESTEEEINDLPEECIDKNIEQSSNALNGVIEDSNISEDDTLRAEMDSSRENVAEVKPLLKIVDFKKLVDPRNLELMNKNQTKNGKTEDASIIVLSSSDDEGFSKNKEQKTSKQNIRASTSGQKSNLATSDSTMKATSNLKEPNKSLLKSNSECLNMDKDKRFEKKPYVKLLRVRCEEMKSFYLSRQKKHESEQRLGETNLNYSSDELISSKIQNKKEKSKRSTKSESDQDEKESRIKRKCKKSEKKDEKHIENSGKTGDINVKVKEKMSNLNYDSSEDERNTKHDEHNKKSRKSKIKKKKKDETDKSDNLTSDEELGGRNNENDTDESVKNRDGALNNLEEQRNSIIKETSGDESCEKSDNNSRSSANIEETQSENKKDTPSKNKGSTEINSSSDKDQDTDTDLKSKEKNNDSGKDIVLSSDDSDELDFDTFFKKNRFVRTRNLKKIKALSDSDEDQDKVKKTECDENEGEESSLDENVSDKDEGQTRKRRRIKEMEDDSSDSNEAITRRKIKKVISKDSLSVQTKKAAAEENQRKQRILEKQRKYNQIYESSALTNSKVEKLILDIDEETDQPLLEVEEGLVSKLKPHQASGVQFMWDACFESLERIGKSEGSGCILAHCMGLGKTLQVIALTHTLLEERKTKVKKVLIVTPLSTVLNWKAEYKNWLSGEESYDVYELATVKAQNSERSCYVREWHENGGVMITSYSMFRNLSNEKNKKMSKKIRNIFIEGLVDPGPDLVICDEGHLLKNEKTSISIAMNKIRTRRRIVLTGTPLQNNLKEYYCMVHFVKPSLLGTYKEYLNRFVNPITNGQYTDSTQYDINLMRRRSHVLHKLLDGIVQRRDYSVLSPYLPPKFEYVLFLTLTDTQRKLYTHYMDHFARSGNDEGSNRASFLFKDFQALSRICIHPRVLLDKSIDDQQKYQSDEESIGSLKDFIADDSSTTTPESSDSESDSNSKHKKRTTKRVTRAQKSNPTIDSGSEEKEEEAEKEWWQQYCDGEELDNIANSTKLMILFEILKECEQIGDKVLVFSQSLYALNMIEYFLEKVDEATQNGDADKKTCGYTGSWAPGLDYFRLDGSTNCGLRSEWCDSFNKESNSRARLFLLSTRAGGLGINLVAANRVILFDVSWNPSSDIQSIYRVYRFGQLKPSYVYRFVIYGTMEMKIYERQVTKQAISKRVIDEQQIDRHYNQSDLAELYKFEVPDLDVRPIPLVPKDVLLGELLQNHDDKVYKYHEHQTLLENKEDETLNEEERKAAWDEFENEKVERTKQTFIGKFSISTVQLALRSIIQRDNPSWNNNQILSIIPQLIQQLNLQLSIGDKTMYNRIAAEIKLMQDHYARKMQLQFQQYRMQLGQNQQMSNLYQQQLQSMTGGYRLPMNLAHPSVSNLNPNAGTFNPNDIVELN